MEPANLRPMRLGSTFKIALRALRRNKLRSVLTALGIIIGVGAVIAMVSIGNGAKAQVEAQIAGLGENIILIFSGSTTSSGIRTGWGGAGTLKIEDAEAIRREVPASPRSAKKLFRPRRSRPEIRTGSRAFYGESADYFDMRQWPLADGAPFTDAGCAQREQGLRHRPERPRRRFTATKSPVGQVLRIKRRAVHRSPACSRRKA